jgi:serine/threonine protein phosphatase PrpC
MVLPALDHPHELVPVGNKLKSPTGYSYEVRQPRQFAFSDQVAPHPGSTAGRRPTTLAYNDSGAPSCAQPISAITARRQTVRDLRAARPRAPPSSSSDAQHRSVSSSRAVYATKTDDPSKGNRATATCGALRCAAISKAGHYGRKAWINQDAFLVDHKSGSTVLAVFDGHGVNGHLVSRYFRANLARELFAHPAFQYHVKEAITETLFKLEKGVKAVIACAFSGSTAVIAVVRGKRMTVANVGDSRLILLSHTACHGIAAHAVTRDHKPERPDERARLLGSGSDVRKNEQDDPQAPFRVYVRGQQVPGLAMSRSLGDVVAHSVGVLSAPEFHETELKATDSTILIATDGLFDVLSNAEIASVAGADANARDVADRLVQRAADRYDECNEEPDDITVIVATIPPADVPAVARQLHVEPGAVAQVCGLRGNLSKYNGTFTSSVRCVSSDTNGGGGDGEPDELQASPTTSPTTVAGISAISDARYNVKLTKHLSIVLPARHLKWLR